jgi:hypothetical protein
MPVSFMADDKGGITDEDFHDAVQEHKINILQYINKEIVFISFLL